MLVAFDFYNLDEYIKKYLAEKELNLTATLDVEAAYKEAVSHPAGCILRSQTDPC